MNETFHPTHRTRAGVEASIVAGPDESQEVILANGVRSRSYRGDVLAAIFEPIPKPKTVNLPLENAVKIRNYLLSAGLCGESVEVLDAALREAEREEANRDC